MANSDHPDKSDCRFEIDQNPVSDADLRQLSRDKLDKSRLATGTQIRWHSIRLTASWRADAWLAGMARS
jgi:hypothetical protein